MNAVGVSLTCSGQQSAAARGWLAPWTPARTCEDHDGHQCPSHDARAHCRKDNDCSVRPSLIGWYILVCSVTGGQNVIIAKIFCFPTLSTIIAIELVCQCKYSPDKGLRWLRNSKIWPSCKVEVSNCPNLQKTWFTDHNLASYIS